MFEKSILFAGMILTTAGTFAHAGVGSSGGGVAQVCRTPQGRINYAEFLDLYEARERFGSLMTSTGTLEGDYLLAVQNTYRLQGVEKEGRYCYGGPCYNEERVRKNLASCFNAVEFLPEGQRLPWLGDVGQVIPPLPIQGCGYEQLAIFHDDTGKIAIDSAIWRAMSPQNQAALVIHELHYKYERELNEKTSEATRSSVGLIFAPNRAVSPVLAGLPAKRLHCFTSDLQPADGRAQKEVSDFYLYPSFAENGDQTGLILQFTHLMGRPLLAQTLAPLKGARSSWDLRFGDPERQASSVGRMVVWEKGADLKQRVPLYGDQSIGWELEIEYAYKRPVRLTLFKRDQAVQAALVDICK